MYVRMNSAVAWFDRSWTVSYSVFVCGERGGPDGAMQGTVERFLSRCAPHVRVRVGQWAVEAQHMGAMCSRSAYDTAARTYRHCYHVQCMATPCPVPS
jgi:hypothetical protein